MSDLRLDFAGLLGDHVEACGDRVMIYELPSLHSVWDGEIAVSPPFIEWYLRTFLGGQEASRVIRGLRAVRRAARGRVAHDIIADIEHGVLEAMYPSGFEVAIGATRHPGNHVAAGLKKLGATEERWRTRY